jgi:RNase P subunit RPR2
MERERYPEDWKTIAHNIKQSAQWTCQGCGRQCRITGEKLSDFILRAFGNLPNEAWVEAIDHPKRFELSVGHLDQNPQNNDPSNLKVMCTSCHLRHDRRFQAFNRNAKRERRGQTNLFKPEAVQ